MLLPNTCIRGTATVTVGLNIKRTHIICACLSRIAAAYKMRAIVPRHKSDSTGADRKQLKILNLGSRKFQRIKNNCMSICKSIALAKGETNPRNSWKKMNPTFDLLLFISNIWGSQKPLATCLLYK